MTKFTKERLTELAAGQSGFNLRIATHEESMEMARQLLASMEQEPVAYMQIDGDEIEYNGHNEFSGGGKGIPLYAAPQLPQPLPEHLAAVATLESKGYTWHGGHFWKPPLGKAPAYITGEQPVVPEAISTRQAISKMEDCEPCDSINVAYKYGWNACRAAMLQGAEPVQGWIPCSERMPPCFTGVLVAAPWPSAPDGYAMKWATNCPWHPDADENGWLIPGASWKPTHWMPLPAAPQQEVKSALEMGMARYGDAMQKLADGGD